MAKALTAEQEKSIGMTEDEMLNMMIEIIDGEDSVSPNSSVRPEGETYGEFMLKPSPYLKKSVGV